jgi:predicted GIY-YIG superfamily endonuclease
MRRNFGPIYVYALIDPIDLSIFYIGVSIDPKTRMQSHRCDPASAAYETIQGLKRIGFDADVVVLSKHTSRRSAEHHERILISALPGLVNRQRRF